MNVNVSKNILNVTIGETSLKLLTSAVVNVDGDADTLQGEDGAYYLDRSNHTGTQAIGTIDGLQAALDNKIESVAWGDITGTLSNQTDLQDALDLKLDAADYNDRFLGLYASLFDLQAAHPTASAGDYAQVDLGIGTDVIVYAWDVNDAKWAAVGSSAIANTDALPEGSSNLYHTSQRVRDVTLTGFTASNSPITSTDSIVQAFGKAQGQLNALSSDSTRTLVYQTPTANKPITNTTINVVENFDERIFDQNVVIPAGTLAVGDVYEIEATVIALRGAVVATQSVAFVPYVNGLQFSISGAQSSTVGANGSLSIDVLLRFMVSAIGASGRIGISGSVESNLTNFSTFTNSAQQTYNTLADVTLNMAMRLNTAPTTGDIVYIKSARLYKLKNP